MRDYLVGALVGAMWIFASVVLALHYSVQAFGIWAGVCTTMIGAYHWLNIHDDLHKDC